MSLVDYQICRELTNHTVAVCIVDHSSRVPVKLYLTRIAEHTKMYRSLSRDVYTYGRLFELSNYLMGNITEKEICI